MDGSPPREYLELQTLIRGYQRSRALTVAAELGIADLLRDGSRDVEELAAAAKFLDLMMLVSAGGRERTEDEWRELLAGADLELSEITRVGPARHVIEAAPA